MDSRSHRTLAVAPPGTLPDKWSTGGPNCIELPPWQVHEYNPDLYILRESGCTHYEKPFLYLFFGKDRALLQDTGAGVNDVRKRRRHILAAWCERNHRNSIPLVVMHSHGHADDTAGDAQFRDRPQTTLVANNLDAVTTFFGITGWPNSSGTIDLGERILDVIPVPGHDPVGVTCPPA